MNIHIPKYVEDKHPYLVDLYRSEDTLATYYHSVRKQLEDVQIETKSQKILSESLIEVCSNLLQYLPEVHEIIDCNPSFLSYAEHHASITHPEMTNVVGNLGLFSGGVKSKVISLSCGTVSLSNQLFPRGLMLGESSIALMSNRFKRINVTCAPAFDTAEALEKIIGTVNRSVCDATDRDIIVDKMNRIMDVASKCCFLWEQITVINYFLAQAMFANGGFLYLCVPLEEISSVILRRWLHDNTCNIVTETLSSPSLFMRMSHILDGVNGFYNTVTGKGTAFFWEQNEGKLNSLSIRDVEKLIAQEIDWDFYLKEKKLIPSSAFSMLVVSFVLGFPNFGGLLQVDYLPAAQKRLYEAGIDIKAQVPKTFYVNFEKRSVTDGGLRRLFSPISWEELKKESNLPLAAHIEDCMQWLITQYSEKR